MLDCHPIGRIDGWRIGEGGKHPPHIILRHIQRDQHQPRASNLVRPCRQARRRMQQRLHAVDDQRPRRVFRQFDDALDAQQLVAMRGTQEVEEHIDRRVRHRLVVEQREGLYALVMAVTAVTGMIVAVSVMTMRVRGLLAEPAPHVGRLRLGIVEPAVEQGP